MRLYRTASGRWAGTQADAGKGYEQVEVPTDKPGLLAWLNENAATKPETGEPPIIQASAPEGKCALCSRDHKAADRGAKKLAAGITARALAERIETIEGWALATLADALIRRLASMKEDA